MIVLLSVLIFSKPPARAPLYLLPNNVCFDHSPPSARPHVLRPCVRQPRGCHFNYHGGPRLCCGVERAVLALVRWCRLRRAAPAQSPAVGRLHTHSRCASNAPPDRPGRSARTRPAEGRHRPGRAQPPVRATGASSCGRKTNNLARKRVAVSWIEGIFLKQTPPQSEGVFVSFVWINSCRKD